MTITSTGKKSSAPGGASALARDELSMRMITLQLRDMELSLAAGVFEEFILRSSFCDNIYWTTVGNTLIIIGDIDSRSYKRHFEIHYRRPAIAAN